MENIYISYCYYIGTHKHKHWVLGANGKYLHIFIDITLAPININMVFWVPMEISTYLIDSKGFHKPWVNSEVLGENGRCIKVCLAILLKSSRPFNDIDIGVPFPKKYMFFIFFFHCYSRITSTYYWKSFRNMNSVFVVTMKILATNTEGAHHTIYSKKCQVWNFSAFNWKHLLK